MRVAPLNLGLFSIPDPAARPRGGPSAVGVDSSRLNPIGKSGFSRTFDTAGEFVRGVWNRGFALPMYSILPKFRQYDPWRAFASSIKSAGEPKSEPVSNVRQ